MSSTGSLLSNIPAHERDQLRSDFDALNEALRATCEELDATKSFKRDIVAHCEKVEAELLALRAENAELVEAMCHPSYEEENRLRAERDALREQEPVATKLETHHFGFFNLSFEDSERLRALPVGAKLYGAPTPPVVLEKLIAYGDYSREGAYIEGWNDAIDEMTAPKPGAAT